MLCQEPQPIQALMSLTLEREPSNIRCVADDNLDLDLSEIVARAALGDELAHPSLKEDEFFIPAAPLAHLRDVPNLKLDFDLPLSCASLVEWDDLEDSESDKAPDSPKGKVPYRKRRGFEPCNAPSQHGTCDGLPTLRKISAKKTLSPASEIVQEPDAPEWYCTLDWSSPTSNWDL